MRQRFRQIAVALVSALVALLPTAALAGAVVQAADCGAPTTSGDVAVDRIILPGRDTSGGQRRGDGPAQPACQVDARALDAMDGSSHAGGVRLAEVCASSFAGDAVANRSSSAEQIASTEPHLRTSAASSVIVRSPVAQVVCQRLTVDHAIRAPPTCG